MHTILHRDDLLTKIHGTIDVEQIYGLPTVKSNIISLSGRDEVSLQHDPSAEGHVIRHRLRVTVSCFRVVYVVDKAI